MVVELLGEHDILSAPSLRETLAEHIRSGEAVVVSVAETEFVDSAVLRVLFDANAELRERGKAMVVHINTASIVKRVFEVVDFRSTAVCTASLDEAIRIAAEQTDGAVWTSG